ncbi:uncharacterized protein At4g30180 [Phalaenopsis equestris]|uniref:uncharacterized protein At4g30180 n=1 Tax=Phalaenopsis equestris TaxID=78828 RepID=UPI0009E2785B|nr:uncharacterized protein At4g30180 [Phalaenopsis equestris]
MEGANPELKRRRSRSGAIRRRETMRRVRRENGGSVRRKVIELQKLVPGGEELRPEQLFARTANYIFQLQVQVRLLQALSKLYVA